MAKNLKIKKTDKEGESKKGRGSLYLPNISRFIPEKFNEVHLFAIGLTFILISALVVGLDLYGNLSLEKKLIGETGELQSKLNFWELESQRHPGYRDAYFNLALINFQLRDLTSSRSNLEKALEIDPNFKKGREFEEILSQSF